MRSLARELGFAFLAWLVPFAAAVAMTPLKRSNLPLFESLIAVALATSTVVLGRFYLRQPPPGSYIARAARAGFLWVLANWALDGLMFSGGPMKMTLPQYAADIGAAYLIIPPILLGLASMTCGAARAVGTQGATR
jgi:hypothetical protein